MRAWEHIINTAMIGTDKPMPGNPEIPGEVAAVVDIIEADELLDKESKYLQKAALVYNYRQCGFTPLQKHDLLLNKAEAETRPYCSDTAAGVLNAILHEDNLLLMELWLTHCSKSGLLALPNVLPAILDKAQKDAALQLLVVACSGNRGAWLSRLNPVWGYFSVLPEEELWQTGNPEQRAKVLSNTRQSDAQLAREWLQQTWEQENAASKTELLKLLRINAGPDDLPWLESLITEKGQKVKDEVMALLKQIPGSSIVKQYEDILSRSVMLKKEKAMLGMMTKISISLKLQASIDESIYKTGIEKLAGPKSGITDEQHVLYQLIGAVPPSFWEKQFEATPAQVVEYFDKYASVMTGALANAVSQFNADDWIPYLLNHDSFYPDFINKLPLPERDKYLLRSLNKGVPNVIHTALNCNQQWGTEFARVAMQQMANHPYEYNRAFFNRYIKLIPTEIISQLEKLEAKDINMQSAWGKNREHLIKLLGLKQQTLKAFNA